MNNVASVNIFIDTNILRKRSWRDRLIDPELIEVIESYKNTFQKECKVLIPETVVKEYCYHHFKLVQDHLDKYKKSLSKLNELLNMTLAENAFDISLESVLSLIKQHFEDSNVEVIDTPYSRLNLANILGKAINYQPPFSRGEEGKKEKGFKDEVIAETILSYLSELTPMEAINYFVCDDNDLVDYLKSSSVELRTLSSIPDLLSDLRLRINRFEADRIDTLTKLAEKVFYKLGDNNSLYIKEGIEARLLKEFPHVFEDSSVRIGGLRELIVPPHPFSEPVAVDNGRFEVSKPTFIKKEDNMYYWQSVIVFRRQYQQSTYLNSGAARIVENIFEFITDWVMEVDTELNMLTAEIRSIKKGAKRGDVVNELLHWHPNFTNTTNTTISGQSTSMVSLLDKIEREG